MKLHALILASTMLASAQAHAVCGSFADQMLYALDGTGANPSDTVTGVVATGTNLTAVTGCIAGTNCRLFNGINSGLVIPYRAAWSDLGPKQCLRVSVHLKANGVPPANGHDVIRNADYPAPRWKMELSDPDVLPGRIRCEADGSAGGVVVASGGPNLYDGFWHEAVCRVMRDPDALEAYVSTCSTSACTETPVLVSRVVAPIGAIVSGNPLTVGRHPEPVDAGFFPGRIDNVRVRLAATP